MKIFSNNLSSLIAIPCYIRNNIFVISIIIEEHNRYSCICCFLKYRDEAISICRVNCDQIIFLCNIVLDLFSLCLSIQVTILNVYINTEIFGLFFKLICYCCTPLITLLSSKDTARKSSLSTLVAPEMTLSSA